MYWKIIEIIRCGKVRVNEYDTKKSDHMTPGHLKRRRRGRMEGMMWLPMMYSFSRLYRDIYTYPSRPHFFLKLNLYSTTDQ
jgi:hypothetical protein